MLHEIPLFAAVFFVAVGRVVPPLRGVVFDVLLLSLERRLGLASGLFEFREHAADMEMKIEAIEGGIAVEVVGKTEAAVQVAQNHARVISGFVEKGSAAAHATHDPVLESPKSPQTPSTR